jgi:hypothetical protein
MLARLMNSAFTPRPTQNILRILSYPAGFLPGLPLAFAEKGGEFRTILRAGLLRDSNSAREQVTNYHQVRRRPNPHATRRATRVGRVDMERGISRPTSQTPPRSGSPSPAPAQK